MPLLAPIVSWINDFGRIVIKNENSSISNKNSGVIFHNLLVAIFKAAIVLVRSLQKEISKAIPVIIHNPNSIKYHMFYIYLIFTKYCQVNQKQMRLLSKAKKKRRPKSPLLESFLRN
jgi:hypothetical protein